MKKSQILAALALAFALGVVAPVAGVSAVDQGSTTLTTNSQKAADAAVKEVKQSFATINTYDEDGDLDEVYTGAAAYGYIDTTVAGALSTALDYVEDAEEKGGAITTAFQALVKARTDLLTGDLAIDDVTDLLADADDWTNADLATSKNTVKEIISLVDKAAKETTVQSDKDSLVKISHDLQEIITDAEIQELVDAEVAKGNFDTIKAIYKQLTGKEAGATNTEARLNAITAAIKNGIGSANWSKYLRVHKLIDKIEDGIENRTASDVTLDRWVAQLKGAENASGDTTVTPADPDTTLKPGNTGLVGSAEGTATTVSIVAGLATALTALGAGVVVYRNARREK